MSEMEYLSLYQCELKAEVLTYLLHEAESKKDSAPWSK